MRTVDKVRLPLHAVKKHGKLLFPVVEHWTTAFLFSEEMREGLRNNQYEYVIVRALSFQRKRLLKRAFEDAIKHKAKARKNGKPALAETYKILANSLYGVFGQRTKDMETIKMYDKEDPMALVRHFKGHGVRNREAISERSPSDVSPSAAHRTSRMP